MAHKSLKSVVHESADAMTKEPKLVPGEASEVRIEKADDGSGYIAHTHHKESKDHGYRPAHKSVHKSINGLKKHLHTAFEGKNMDEEDDEDGGTGY